MCSSKPTMASTACCSDNKVNVGVVKSNMMGRYLSLPRTRPIAVASMRRWSDPIEVPVRLATPGSLRGAGKPAAALSRQASSTRPASYISSYRSRVRSSSQPRSETPNATPMRSSRVRRMFSSSARSAQARSADIMVFDKSAGTPLRQSSQGKKSYQERHCAPSPSTFAGSAARAR